MKRMIPTIDLSRAAVRSSVCVLGVLLAACEDQGGSERLVDDRSSEIIVEIETARLDDAFQEPWPPAGDETVDRLDAEPTRDNVMLALDMSGSMDEHQCAGNFDSKAEAARTAFKAWVDTVPEETNIGLAIFGPDGTRLAVPLGRSGAHRGELFQAVDATNPRGGTPLSDAVALARGELERQALYQQGYGTYRLVVITDGEHTNGYDPRAEVKMILANRNNPIEIHTIGFCIDDSALNLEGYTYYQSASNPDELKGGLENVLAEVEQFDPTDFENLTTGEVEE